MGENYDASENNEAGLKGIGVILTIIALITGVAAIITPMNNQLKTMQNSIVAMEERVYKNIDQLDDKFQIEIDNLKEYNTTFRSHVEKHEGNNARMDERIIDLKEHVQNLEKKCEKQQDQIIEFLYKNGKGGSQ